MTEITSPRFKELPPLPTAEPQDGCDVVWISDGLPTPLAEPHEGDDALGLRPGMYRFGDGVGVDRFVTLESVDKDWNIIGWQYFLTPADALRLAADLTDAAWTLLDDKKESGR